MNAIDRDIALSDLQIAVVRVLWRNGETSVTDIAKVLGDERGLKHTTVATLLTRLEKRGVVEQRREGRQLIYRALVSEPKALILDEPSAGLDVVARLRFLETVRGIARQGTTIVLITHHVEEVIPEIGRIIFLKDGRADSDGPKAAMLTSERLGQLFGGPVAVDRHDGYFHVTTNGAAQ